MTTAILILLVLAAGVFIAFRAHEIGGSVEIRVGEHFVGVSFPIAVLILIAFILVVLALVMLWGWLRRAPAKARASRVSRLPRRRSRREARRTCAAGRSSGRAARTTPAQRLPGAAA